MCTLAEHGLGGTAPYRKVPMGADGVMAGIMPALLRDTPDVEPFHCTQPHNCQYGAAAPTQHRCAAESARQSAATAGHGASGKHEVEALAYRPGGDATPAHQALMHEAVVETGAPEQGRHEWQSAELAAMAAAWDTNAIERCVMQAHYAQHGYIDEEELGWLHIPEDWPHTNSMVVGVGHMAAHTPTEVLSDEEDANAATTGSDAACGGMQRVATEAGAVTTNAGEGVAQSAVARQPLSGTNSMAAMQKVI